MLCVSCTAVFDIFLDKYSEHNPIISALMGRLSV